MSSAGSSPPPVVQGNGGVPGGGWASGGMIRGGPPTMAQLARYTVNRPGWEAVNWELFDSATYAAAGQLTLNFFQNPEGQGTGFGGGTKTASDTNMVSGGQLPAAQEFLVKQIEVAFWPTMPTVAAQMPAAYGAAAISQIVNDAYIFTRSGNLTLTIGSKNYVQDGPMNRFPSCRNFHLDAAAADATTAAASSQTRIAYAYAVGMPWRASPADLLLVSNQNFVVQLAWPEGLQAITNPAIVRVYLGGYLYRMSQ